MSYTNTLSLMLSIQLLQHPQKSSRLSGFYIGPSYCLSVERRRLYICRQEWTNERKLLQRCSELALFTLRLWWWLQNSINKQ